MRIGINGKIASVGQAYVTLDEEVNGVAYVQGEGQPLSTVGTIITLENGADQDQFFLTFDRIGANTNVLVEADPPPPVFEGSAELVSDVGYRNFAEIRHSFAQITGIDPTPRSSDPNNPLIGNVYDTVIQQLPPAEDITGFLASNQAGITQLALNFCVELVGTKSARDALSIDLDEVDDPNVDDANAKSVADWDGDFINPIMTAMLNSNLAVQPDVEEVRDIVHHLLFTDADGIDEIDPVNDPDPHGLSRCTGGCADGQTEIAAIAACTAMLGSAAVTLQ